MMLQRLKTAAGWYRKTPAGQERREGSRMRRQAPENTVGEKMAFYMNEPGLLGGVTDSGAGEGKDQMSLKHLMYQKAGSTQRTQGHLKRTQEPT